MNRNKPIEETYIAERIENVEFTELELREMGIVFFDDLEDLVDLAKDIGFTDITSDSQLVDFNLTLSQVGSISKPTWALHELTLMQEYVCDVWNKSNFYKISVKEKDKEVEIVNRAYLRDESLEDDLLYYLEDRLIELERDQNASPNMFN